MKVKVKIEEDSKVIIKQLCRENARLSYLPKDSVTDDPENTVFDEMDRQGNYGKE